VSDREWRCRLEVERDGIYERNRFMAMMRFARWLGRLLRKPPKDLIRCEPVEE